MARFYFDVTINGDGDRDQDGTELRDRDAACREAMIAAAEMAKGLVFRNQRSLAIKVRDGSGRLVTTVRLSLAVEEPR